MNGRGHPGPEQLIKVGDGEFRSPARVLITHSRLEQIIARVTGKFDEVTFLPSRKNEQREVDENFGN